MTGSLLPDDQRRAALARTASDWMAIYIEIVERQLRSIEQRHSVHGDAEILSRWVTEGRPRLKTIGERFTTAGLVLDEQMEVSGIEAFEPPNVIFLTPAAPYVTFHWPDGSTLTFSGEEAGSAMGFFIWWANFQTPVLGPDAAKTSRLILPGTPEHTRYMQAKQADQRKGIEPA